MTAGVKVQATVPLPTLERLEMIAETEGTSVAEVVRLAVYEYTKRPTPPRQGEPLESRF